MKNRTVSPIHRNGFNKEESGIITHSNGDKHLEEILNNNIVNGSPSTFKEMLHKCTEVVKDLVDANAVTLFLFDKKVIC